MKTREKKSKWIYGVIGIAVVVVGIILGTTLGKGADAELVVTAENIELEEGSTREVIYQSSIKDAEIRLRVVDTKIAEVNGKEVVGKTAGGTELTITARYKSLVYEKRVSVIVTEKVIVTDPEKPEVPTEPTNPDESNKGEEKPDTPPVEEEIEVEIYASGCTVNDNEIEMTIGKTARVSTQVSFGYEEFSAESEEGRLRIRVPSIGQSGYFEITADEEGECEITLRYDNKKVTIKVRVKGE